MSLDLTVFSPDRPDVAAVVARVVPEEVRVEGEPGAEREPWLALTRVTRSAERHLCSVDGPLEAEDEDAPPDVASVLLAVRWTIQITMPASLTQAEHRIVTRLARALADDGRGVVHDPQADVIAWPRNPEAVRRVEAADDDSDETRGQVELELALPRHLTATDAHALLAILREMLPEAVPVRFGDYEPPQGRLGRDGDDAFAAMWDGTTSLFWRGQRPFEWGHVSLRRGWGSALPEAEREARRPVLGGRKAFETDGLSLEFRADLAGDPVWLGALRALFVRLCEELRPFFAAAFTTPGPDDEDVVLQGRYWLGVPPLRFWLVYAGAPYAPLIPADHPSARRVGDGVLVELADRPDDWEAIDRRAIPWPAEVVRRGTQLEEDLAADVIPELRTR